MADASPDPIDLLPVDPLDALRIRGAQRIDPVGLFLAESLARRAAAHEGTARRVLAARVAARIQAVSDVLDRADALRGVSASLDQAERSGEVVGLDDGRGDGARAAHGRSVLARTGVAGPGPLAGLVADLAARKPMPAGAPAAREDRGAPERASPADAKTLQYFRSTWSRLNADQRLAQSRSSLPGNAGPLNSHHLVHRAMSLMRELSPEYLERFVGHVEALLWVEQANEAAAQEVGLPGRAGGGRKAARGRPA